MSNDHLRGGRMKNTVHFALVLLCISATLLSSCNRAAQPPVETTQAGSQAKRHRLKGKVVSVDKQAKMVNVDAEAIPDFMGAMTMPYSVKPERDLEKLSPGDAITADVVVQDDKYWLENIAVLGHPAAPASK